jgi:hypothetical protein
MSVTEEELRALLDSAIRSWEYHSEKAGATMEQIIKIKNELGL